MCSWRSAAIIPVRVVRAMTAVPVIASVITGSARLRAYCPGAVLNVHVAGGRQQAAP